MVVFQHPQSPGRSPGRHQYPRYWQKPCGFTWHDSSSAGNQALSFYRLPQASVPPTPEWRPPLRPNSAFGRYAGPRGLAGQISLRSRHCDPRHLQSWPTLEPSRTVLPLRLHTPLTSALSRPSSSSSFRSTPSLQLEQPPPSLAGPAPIDWTANATPAAAAAGRDADGTIEAETEGVPVVGKAGNLHAAVHSAATAHSAAAAVTSESVHAEEESLVLGGGGAVGTAAAAAVHAGAAGYRSGYRVQGSASGASASTPTSSREGYRVQGIASRGPRPPSGARAERDRKQVT